MKKTTMIAVAVGLLLNACTDKNETLSGAGATFPLPYYNLAFKEYSEKNNTEVSYGGIGSGGGVRSLKDKVSVMEQV